MFFISHYYFPLAFIVLFSTEAQALSLRFGDPTAPKPPLTVTVEYRLSCPTEEPNIANISIPMVNANFTAEGKAARFLGNLGRKCGGGTRDGAVVSMPRVVKAEKLQGDSTEEEDLFATIAEDEVPLQAEMDYHGQLVGLDSDGGESVFRASFGFNEIVADSVLPFSQIGTPTIDGLLMATFSELLLDLPTLFQANLSLDLDNDLIAFVFPDSASNGFVSTSTTDIGTTPTFSLEVAFVPEPTSTLGLLALGTLGAGSALKRKLNQKSTEKETTKAD